MRIELNHTPHQAAHRAAVEAGMKRLGSPDLPRTVVCWGWRGGRLHLAKGQTVIVLERGYIGDRFAYSSIGLNGLNGRAKFPPAPDDGGARFRSFGVPIRDYEDTGDHVLLVGQVHGDMSLQGRDMTPWYAQAAREAERAYGLPVLFRQHPMEARKGIRRTVQGCQNHTGDLYDAMRHARTVVTYNSNTGVDSILYGRDTVVSDKGAMAYPVASHRMGEPSSRSREKWAYDLAWKQWSLDEIRSGEALAGIVEILRGC